MLEIIIGILAGIFTGLGLGGGSVLIFNIILKFRTTCSTVDKLVVLYSICISLYNS